MEEAVRGKLLGIFRAAMKDESFGNGRFARTLVEKAVLKQAERLVEIGVDSVTKADLETLTADDFEPPVVQKKEQRMGFAV
jgi:hypothetical protein